MLTSTTPSLLNGTNRLPSIRTSVRCSVRLRRSIVAAPSLPLFVWPPMPGTAWGMSRSTSSTDVAPDNLIVSAEITEMGEFDVRSGRAIRDPVTMMVAGSSSTAPACAMSCATASKDVSSPMVATAIAVAAAPLDSSADLIKCFTIQSLALEARRGVLRHFYWRWKRMESPTATLAHARCRAVCAVVLRV